MKKIVIIGQVWPEPNSTAAGVRMLQLIDFFKNKEYEIHFASAASRSDNSYNLSSIDVNEVTIKLNHSSFDDWLKDLSPDIVMYDRFMVEEQYSWRVSESCPNALQILDTEDLHFVRKGRREGYNLKHPELLTTDIAKREIASIYRCDLNLIISEAEMDFLIDKVQIPESILLYLPFMMDDIGAKEINTLPDYDTRSDFITIGSFKHAPNVDSVYHLKSEMWPRIREHLPDVKIHIYGSYATSEHLSLSSEKEGFFVHGFVEEADLAYQNSRVCLAPLRYGAGLKGKVFQAWANGTPCVMSTIAAEGFIKDDTPSHLIADDAASFAYKAVEVYNNGSVWKQSQIKGFETINTKFSKTFHYSRFENKLLSVLLNLKTHRQNNFIGEIFKHHTLRSTKFLGKYIEEKNR